MDTLVSKEALSEKLGVSLATVNNWIKTRVIPQPDCGNFYTLSIFENILDKVKSDSKRLNSRANRTLLKKKNLHSQGIADKDRKELLAKIVNAFEKSDLSIDEGVQAFSFAVLRSANLIDEKWQKNTNSELDKLLSQWIKNYVDQDRIINFFMDYKIPNRNDDILGAFYQSILNISQKSGSGSFYTPPELLNDIKIPDTATVLDPCCGSGNILLNILSQKRDPEKIHARDIDETALKICFINLALFFNNKDIKPHISKQDILIDSGDLLAAHKDTSFDYIVTNPPWGGKFSPKQKERLLKLYPELETTETFSISLHNALKMLKKNGELYFFLPFSFLNVAGHRKIRSLIFNRDKKISITLLGNAFKGVLSESILLHVKSNSVEKNVYIKSTHGGKYCLPLESIAPPDYIVSAASNSEDMRIITRIYSTKHTTLGKDDIFALGIVTGNNEKHLSRIQTEKMEAIYRGQDMEKYFFLEPKYFMVFQPGLYQQAAPVAYFRQKKIAYRFISDRLVCVLDTHSSLLLNSANLFISKNYPMETIVALFNSDIYSFMFMKKYHSRKVLKSHLQNLPLPLLPETIHHQINDLYTKTFTIKEKNIPEFQKEIDRIICEAFLIEGTEYNYIKENLY